MGSPPIVPPLQLVCTPPAYVSLCHQYLPSTATNTTARLAALRGTMRAHGVHAYIVPSTDAHMVRQQIARAPGDGLPGRCPQLHLTALPPAPE